MNEKQMKPLILSVTADGLQRIDIDEDGLVAYCDSLLQVTKNTISDRIMSAAAGGMDVTSLPSGLNVYYSDDVEVLSVSELGDGDRVMVLLLPMIADGAAPPDRFQTCDTDTINRGLEERRSTLRAVIFEGDLVHNEAEPEIKAEFYDAAAALRDTKFLDVAQERLGMTETQIVSALGYSMLAEADPLAVFMWAADNGLDGYLPEEYRFEQVTSI